MWDTIRYRRLQALTMALLAALVTTCAVFAPLYSRAMQQAITRVELDRATVASRSISVSASVDTDAFGDQSLQLPNPNELPGVVPGSIRRFTGSPLLSWGASAGYKAPGQVQANGAILWRSHACDHLRFTDGGCPQGPGDIAVSTADAKALGMEVGTSFDTAAVESNPDAPPPTVTLTVVGIYRQLASNAWFGVVLTGYSGTPGGPTSQPHDIWITSNATFADTDLEQLPNPTVTANLPLAVHRVGVDQLLALSRQVDRFQTSVPNHPGQAAYRVFTRLPTIAADVRHQRAQSRVTVPLLMLQLGLLGVVVLWLVLGSATEQRRPETAVAMLRGRGRAGARGLLLRELLPVVLAGVPVGAVAALGLCWVARGVLLPGSAPFEVGRTAIVAVVGSAVVLALVTYVAAATVTREPVERLLRRVPVRRAGWSMGVLEALVVAASGFAVVAFVTGSLTGPVSLIAPAVLALFVGLVLAHAVAPLATAAGRRLLRRGRVGVAVSVLDAARTPAGRRTVAIVTVASALLVFAVSAVIVGANNRRDAAEQEAGAPVTMEVYGNNLDAVRAAVHQVDPDGRRLSPTVAVFPPQAGAQETLAVVPASFARIAFFPGRAQPPDLKALAPPTAKPIQVQGDQLAVTLAGAAIGSRAATHSPQYGQKAGPPDPPPEVTIELDLVDRAGETLRLPIGDLPQGTSNQSVSRTLHCRDGCNLVGVSVLTSPGARVTGTVTLSALSVTSDAGSPTSVPLGPSDDWAHVTSTKQGTMLPSSPSGTDLTIKVETTGPSRTTLNQNWLPQRVPALTTRGRPDSIAGLDGQDRAAHYAGRLAPIPRAGPEAALVNLDVASRGTPINATDRIEVWSAGNDAALRKRFRAALDSRGVQLANTATLHDARVRFDQSTASWSLALGVVVGVASLLLAVLVVIVLAATSWRARSRDLAALRLAGVPARTVRSVATLAQVPTLVVAVVAGALSGVLGARLTLPRLPLFAHQPAVSTLDLGLPWPWLVAAAAVALALLVATGWTAGAAIARRADLQRVREQL